MTSLLSAVTALDPGNVEAKELIAGSAVRRQMTLMFCDLVGSTRMADDRDPEEVTAVLRAYRGICTETIDRFGGFIDDHRGDGMLVLFGYPQVNEDDARRAVQCAREIIAAVHRRLGRTLGRDEPVGLQVRIAVHTDLVVLDGVGVAGATANEASRIQAVARPDSVVISDATKALVWPYFETSSLGVVELRGVSRPIEIFTVVRERHVADLGQEISPFVGRTGELDLIEQFTRATAPILLIAGQPGVGKTRLAAEAARRHDQQVLECRCSRMHQATSLHVFRPLLERACGIDENDTPDGRLRKLRAHVGDSMTDYGDLPFLATALDIPLSALAAPVAINPDALRQLAIHAAAEVVLGLASADRRTTLLIDDVHWADQSSLELIPLLTASTADALRLVLTTRDEFEPPWPAGRYSTLNLDPLRREDLQELAELRPEAANLSTDELNELIERSDGIPLFLEELLRTADALGRGEIVHRSIRFGDYQIPPALLDPLLARLSSPQVDLELAQLAATIGRDIDGPLLRHLTGGTDTEFRNRIDTLLAAGLLEQSSTGYRFRHELIREVAYETQKRTTRRHNHATLADAIGADPHAGTRRLTAERAVHLERAGRRREAIAAHIEAATADQSVGAHAEVTRRLSHVLELIEHMPPGHETMQTELCIRGMRSFSAVTAGGFGVPEAAEDYRRTGEISSVLVGDPASVPALINSWSYYASRGELREADAVVDSLESQLKATDSPIPGRQVCRGVNEFLRGNFAYSHSLLDGFIASGWADTDRRPPEVWQLPSDPLAAVGGNQAFTTWVQGEPELAERYAADAHRRAEELDFPFGPFTACYIDHHQAMAYALAGDFAGVAVLGTHMSDLANRHGFALWQLTGALHLEFSAVMLGQGALLDQFAEHVTMISTVLAQDSYTPYWLTQLAVAFLTIGEPVDAALLLDQALEVTERTECAFFSAETFRVRGETQLAGNRTAGILDIRHALRLATAQGAPVLAMRARATLPDENPA